MRKKIGRMAWILIAIIIAQGASGEVYYPWKSTYIGALDSEALAGLVLAPNPDDIFAFRLRIHKGEESVEGLDLMYLLSEVGPHSPDGKYARLKFDISLDFGIAGETPVLKKPSRKQDTLVLEWSRQAENTVVGRVKVPEKIRVDIIHYFPWNSRGNYQEFPNNQIRGTNSSNSGFGYLFWSSKEGQRTNIDSSTEYILSYGEENDVYFCVGVGEDPKDLEDHLYRYKNEKTIDSFLKEEALRYEKARVRIKGLYEGVGKAITNNLFWMTLYQPEQHRLYTPAGRRWIYPKPDGPRDHWTIFEWDSFLSALELSIESSKHALDVVKSVLQTQYPNGNIPNWRSRYNGTPDRSQPPIGSYVVYKLFQRTGDEELLKFAYPYLKRWHSFWKARTRMGNQRRDGNNDGLLEWGSDSDLVGRRKYPEREAGADGKQRAKWESGQEDLPNWDDAGFSEASGTLTMNCVDLNSLYALDAHCLSTIASILDNRKDARTYSDEYKYMKELINRTFWDNREGFYFDRHWDGSLSTRKAASNFFPMIAMIPSDEQSRRMIKHLLNENLFWGEYVIPTISRDDPAFSDQTNWRGKISPPTNYLVYQGLKAYGHDAVASEFAQRSEKLFMRSWDNYQLSPENYDSRTGEAGGSRFHSCGPLFALIGLEEYMDFTLWDGFRFGIQDPERKGILSRIAMQGRHYELKVSSKGISLREEGNEIVKANNGAVFRQFLYLENEVSFDVTALDETKITIRFLTKGKYQLMMNDQTIEIFSGKAKKIKVPVGKTKILILLLERHEDSR
ncbi:amylo-alpha-1,6-glucosidase [Acidobacteriota bacterium]